MIEIINLSSGYTAEAVIKQANVQLPDNSITTVIGPNGSGKSTLLKSIAGLCHITKGSICVNGDDIKKISSKELAKTVRYLSQQHNTPSISVERMVLHGRFPYINFPRSYSPFDYECCASAMKQTGIYPLRHKNVSTLSGGEQQKVYLAMLLCGEAEYLLLDEPTTYLDIHCQLGLLQIIKALKEKGKTLFMVLHDFNFALQVSDFIIVLQRGKVVAQGTPKELLSSSIFEEIFQVRPVKLTDSSGRVYFTFELPKTNYPQDFHS
ncbi:MAG: ABC transporter ATP-binding protein [Acetivibrio ethanolgignens]